MIFVDAHVHIYDCFDVDLLLDSALKNFQAAAEEQESGLQVSFVLLLTEGATEDWLHKVARSTEADGQSRKKISSKWSGAYSKDFGGVTVFRNDSPEKKIEIVGGRQVVTREKIEVLALFCTHTITNGLSLEETIDAVERSGAIPVLPWGVGKWIGKRGGIIKRYLTDHPKRRLFLGDNGGRPVFWPTPTFFHFGRKAGVTVLPGTDPLPIPAEAARVGSYGFYVAEEENTGDPTVLYLKNVLLAQKEIFPCYGRLQTSRAFFVNQIRLRFS